MDTWIDEVIEAKGGTIEEVRQKGFIRWMLETEKTFDTKTMTDDCHNCQMRFDPEPVSYTHLTLPTILLV